MSNPKLRWEKASHSRYYAKLGLLSIEVRRLPDLYNTGTKERWVIGEMFGNHHTAAMKPTYLVDAQLAAERLAMNLLVDALNEGRRAEQ